VNGQGSIKLAKLDACLGLHQNAVRKPFERLFAGRPKQW
jgi:hypothetical protein